MFMVVAFFAIGCWSSSRIGCTEGAAPCGSQMKRTCSVSAAPTSQPAANETTASPRIPAQA
jgi:hypothetical protein